ncbi:MAG: ABC transporter permease subunit [Alphaproteobacteria bacterium]|nr:ABC transporter permease subunit [Alphaproteobacteria bacterium]
MRQGIGWPIWLALFAVWTGLFLVYPFLIVLKISLAESILARPPYTPLFARGGDGWSGLATLDNYVMLVGDDLYLRSLLNSLRLAAIATVLALALALPMAHAIARAPARWRGLLLILVLLPLWVSFLIRVYAWIAILKPEGLLNAALLALGAISTPLTLLGTDAAVVIGLVYSYLPFMLLPIYASFARLDPALGEAAADLGATASEAFWRVLLPAARPGVIAGCLLVFIPAVGEAIIPDLLGGAGTVMIGKTLWTEFFQNRDWPLASAVAVALLLLLLGPVLWAERRQATMIGGGP